MNKAKRITAMIGVVLLLSLYLLTFISSFFSSGPTNQLFSACIFSTIVVPVMLYVYMLIYKLVHRKDISMNPDNPDRDEDTPQNGK